MKKIFISSFIAFTLAGIVALPVSALSIDDLQAQIRDLMARIATLTAQIDQLKAQEQGSTTTFRQTPALLPGYPHRICGFLNRTLAHGAYGDDVRGLQEFLQAEGYFSTTPSGFFGPITALAVSNWQAAQGVDSVGTFGPLSRERLKKWCGGLVNKERFTASPMRGDAPLTVTFNTWLSGFRPASVSYTITYGDGTSENAAPCPAPTDICTGPGQNTHTYTQNGTYTATLTKNNPAVAACAPDLGDCGVVARVKIHVGPVACTNEYKPVCGAKPIVCVTTPCNPVPTTYSNRCAMEADSATFLYEGQCRSVTYDPGLNPQCKVWTDGCNTCSRSTQGGPGTCTVVGCTDNYLRPAPKCIEHFPIICTDLITYNECGPGMVARFEYSTSSCPISRQCVPANKAPVISSFSGSTTLAVGQTGTWTIQASDPENQTLGYSISWGDIPLNFLGVAAPQASSFTQMTTFTHAYLAAGVYTVRITVRDSEGKTAEATTTVSVSGSDLGCTTGSTPVCGSIACVPPNIDGAAGANCVSTTTQMTFSNRCTLNAAGATYLYEGACGSSVSNASCTTPWGNQVVQHNGTISSYPYFSDGGYPSSFLVPLKRCNNGSWLTCDASGNNCR